MPLVRTVERLATEAWTDVPDDGTAMQASIETASHCPMSIAVVAERQVEPQRVRRWRRAAVDGAMQRACNLAW